MSKFINPDLIKQITKHEGVRRKIYWDSCVPPIPTIGIGHNLNIPLHMDVVEFMFMYDLQVRIKQIKSRHPWILEARAMSQVRRNAFIGMVFNLGINRFGKFKRMIAAAKVKDWQAAHDEALDSLWAKQVKGRAKTLAKKILNG